MDLHTLPEKNTNVYGEGQIRHNARRSTPAWRTVGLLVICAIMVRALVQEVSQTWRPRFRANGATYSGENIRWTPCGEVNNHDVECSAIRVPMDQFSTTNSGDQVFNIPLFRLRGSKAKESILLNPGGPGASGYEFVFNYGKELQDIVGEDFHLLSFDPRGVNSSTPLASCYPDEETRQQLGTVRKSDVIRDSPELYAWSTNFVRACRDSLGEHGKYLNTPQTAADMNSILEAIGQRDMLYWGFSYGTVLGQVYATLYPEKSKRILIDGVADQRGWFEEQLDSTMFTDTDTVHAGFYDECVKAGKVCPLSKYGTTGPELADRVATTINKLRNSPLSVYIDTHTHGILDDSKLWNDGIFRELYQPKTWPRLASSLAELLEGNATSAFLNYGRGDLFHPQGEAFRVIALNDAATGPAYWPQERKELLRLLLPWFDQHRFATASPQLTYYLKQQWDMPKTHEYKPVQHVETAHPLLIVSMTYDPVCPLKAAEIAAKTFEGSRIVEVQGYGHCSLAMPSTCAAKHIRAYFSHGTMPEEGVKCEISAEYFPSA